MRARVRECECACAWNRERRESVCEKMFFLSVWKCMRRFVRRHFLTSLKDIGCS